MDDQQRDISSHFSDISSDLFKFVLQRGNLRAHRCFFYDLSQTGILAHDKRDHPAFTLGDWSARHKYWWG